MMNKVTTLGMFAAMVAVMTLASVGETGGSSVPGTNATKRVRKPLTPEQVAEREERRNQRMTGGGIVRKDGSAKGAFVVLNAQTKVGEDDLSPVLAYIDRALAARTTLVKADVVSAGNIGAKIREAGATIGVGLVDDAMFPSLLVAPETGWAIVNVAKLGEKCPDGKTLASRVRKEILRSLAFTTGCAYTTMVDPLMRDVTKPGDVDALQSEEFGLEIINRFSSSAPLYGLKPWYSATYKEACEAGWAPAPTNSYQRWVWKKVHSPPKNPIKIEYDPKKGR